MIEEWPSPSARLHNRFGPPAGHVSASPLASTIKLRCGPPHCGQLAVWAEAALEHNRKQRQSQIVWGQNDFCFSANDFIIQSFLFRLVVASLFRGVKFDFPAVERLLSIARRFIPFEALSSDQLCWPAWRGDSRPSTRLRAE